MSKNVTGPEITELIRLMSKLPGLGPRSARRAALHLLQKKDQLMRPLAKAMTEAAEKVIECSNCGNIDTISPCAICQDERRDKSMICLVETVGDLWALERAEVIKEQYHVLGGTLSPLDGIGPDDLNISTLIERANSEEVTEILIALNATVEGQSTAHYITDLLEETNVKVSRLAHGVPVGGELDYLDEGTLAAAIKSRKEL
jgi:recombination protein RecR